MSTGLIPILFLLLSITAIADKLKLSILIFRHGDRSPVYSIPTDIYKADTSWPQGAGFLSTIGIESQFNNGRFFRARYTDPNLTTFLGIDPAYKRTQVYVRSTDRDRTIMSAQSFLAGLFPPTSSSEVSSMPSPFDVWQPIPVHNVPKKLDAMLEGQPETCPTFHTSFRKTVTSNPEFQAFVENKTDITKRVIEICGWPHEADIFDTYRQLSFATYDTLFCEISHNYTLKQEFVEANLFDLVTPYDAMDWKLYSMMTDQEKGLCGGVLLHELKVRVQAAVQKTDDIKLILFSAHDTTLAAILTCLGAYDGGHTPYSTVLMFEVWETEDGGHVIKLLRHHNDDDLITYTLPGCDEGGCTLDQFYSLNEHLELTEERFFEECSQHLPDFVSDSAKSSHNHITYNLNIVFLLLCFSVLISISDISTLSLYIHKHKNNYSKASGDERNSEQEELDDSLTQS